MVPDPKDFFPVPPPITVEYRGSKTTLVIGDMTIYCSYNIPVAFKRGVVNKRLADRVSATTLQHLSAFGARNFDVLDMYEFPVQLMEHLKAAMRRLSSGYDVVHESKHYAKIIVDALEQLDGILRIEWSDPARLHETVQLVREFLFERLMGLIKTDTSSRHLATAGAIGLEALRDIISKGALEPTERATNGLPIETAGEDT